MKRTKFFTRQQPVRLVVLSPRLAPAGADVTVQTLLLCLNIYGTPQVVKYTFCLVITSVLPATNYTRPYS